MHSCGTLCYGQTCDVQGRSKGKCTWTWESDMRGQHKGLRGWEHRQLSPWAAPLCGERASKGEICAQHLGKSMGEGGIKASSSRLAPLLALHPMGSWLSSFQEMQKGEPSSAVLLLSWPGFDPGGELLLHLEEAQPEEYFLDDGAPGHCSQPCLWDQVSAGGEAVVRGSWGIHLREV